jgi:thiol-disulfide isomerase/thioredoxin
MGVDPFEPPPDEEAAHSADAKKAARPYSVAVGVLFLIAVVVAGLNSLNNQHGGTGGLNAWTPFPRFAAPTATGSLDGDANINPSDADASGKARIPACEVRGSPRDVVRICDFVDRPLVLVAWFPRGCGTCKSQLDTVEAVRQQFPRVGFVGLDVAGSKADARRRVLANGWRFPMAVDRDGAVSGLYRVGVGPMTFFAYPGGITMSTTFGELDERALVGRVRRLVAASRRLELFP